MIPIIVRIFGFLLLMAFVFWTLYVFWLGLKQFFTPKTDKKSSKHDAISPRLAETN